MYAIMRSTNYFCHCSLSVSVACSQVCRCLKLGADWTTIKVLFSSKIDVLDLFTEELLKEKTKKWASFRKAKSNEYIPIKKYSLITCPENNYDDDGCVLNLDYSSVCSFFEKYLQNVIGNENIITVLNSCIERAICPPKCILLALASKLGRLGDKDAIKALQKLCKMLDPEEYANQAGYVHFLAEATWICGNVSEGLHLFSCIYNDHAPLRRKIRHMVKYLIADVVERKGEASFVLVTKFCKTFASQYRDYYFLSYLWELCFLSEWYIDNAAAHDFLKEYPELQSTVKRRAQIVAVFALQKHHIEVVHRLMEILLQYEMKEQYEKVLQIFFDYKCVQGDIQGCSAVIKSSLDLNVCLTSAQHEKFLKLLINCPQKQLARSKQWNVPLCAPKRFYFKF